MRKLGIVVLTVAALGGPFAGVAAAGPVEDVQTTTRATFCAVQEALGFDNVQECTLSR